jgi:riboflavin synthase
MFTGIIEEVGVIKATQAGGLSVFAPKICSGIKIGDSIALNGACLTVTALGTSSFWVEVMPETLRRTNLGILSPGNKVNLERALSLGERLGGHLVQGHVDAVGKIASMVAEAEAIIARYTAPPQVIRYIVEKGFIAVDGVSLTIIDHDAISFRVSLVSYTRQHTILGSKHPGEWVNLEADLIAKYVERFTQGRSSPISAEFLAEHGFLDSIPPAVKSSDRLPYGGLTRG